MAGTRKWWSVKKIGGELKTVQAVDIRSAALKSFGLNPARQQYGIWFDSETRIAQVTKHTKNGNRSKFIVRGRKFNIINKFMNPLWIIIV